MRGLIRSRRSGIQLTLAIVFAVLVVATAYALRPTPATNKDFVSTGTGMIVAGQCGSDAECSIDDSGNAGLYALARGDYMTARWHFWKMRLKAVHFRLTRDISAIDADAYDEAARDALKFASAHSNRLGW